MLQHAIARQQHAHCMTRMLLRRGKEKKLQASETLGPQSRAEPAATQ